MAQIALVDDHHLFTSALAIALRAHGLDVDVPPVDTVPQLLDHLARRRPDVLLVDRDLGATGSGEDLIAPASAGGMTVVVVAATLDEVTQGRCLAMGALTCLPKTVPFTDVLDTVVSVATGTWSVRPAERQRLIDLWRRSQSTTTAVGSRFALLTHREAEVLALLITGRRVKEIAAHQRVSSATVRTHVRSILEKLRVTSQLEAVALAAEAGWRPPRVPPGAVPPTAPDGANR